MQDWKKRYREAHYQWCLKHRPAVVKDGHYTFFGMPQGIYKAKGLKEICCNFCKWTGHHLEPTNNVGIPIDNRRILTDIVGRQKQIGSLEWQRSGMTRGTTDCKGHIKPTRNKYPVPIYIEIKAGSDYMREDQKAYKEMVTNTGAFHCIVKIPEDFFEFYDYILNL